MYLRAVGRVFVEERRFQRRVKIYSRENQLYRYADAKAAERQPRSDGRMQPTTQAVGNVSGHNQAPKGRKKAMT